MKKASGGVILQLCTKNHNLMMHASCDEMGCDRHNFCHFGPFFALLPDY